MRIVYLARSFLDYRVPVFAALDELLNHRLYVVFSSDLVPKRVFNKIKHVLGSRAIGLSCEWQFGNENLDSMANSGVSFGYHPRLLNVIKTCQPSVLVSDGFFKWTCAALWLRASKKIPHVVCYERTAHTERNAHWYRVTYRKFVMRWIDAICCNGKLCGEYVQSLGFPAAWITFGHVVADTAGLENSVTKVTDKHISELRTKYDLKGTIFLYVSRLTPRKGLIKLLNAWKRFNDSISADEATLFLVGDGPQRQECESFCSQNSLQNVRYAGVIDYDGIAPYYKAANAFIIPTLEDNWSLVVPEAMVCGLPILCSKYNGCWPELVHPGENGWVFDPLEYKDILQCLKVCMKNRDHLSQMGERSKVIVGNHTPVKAAESIFCACKIAIERNKKSG